MRTILPIQPQPTELDYHIEIIINLALYKFSNLTLTAKKKPSGNPKASLSIKSKLSFDTLLGYQQHHLQQHVHRYAHQLLQPEPTHKHPRNEDMR